MSEKPTPSSAPATTTPDQCDLLVERFGRFDVTWHYRTTRADAYAPLTGPPSLQLLDAHLHGLLQLGVGLRRADGSTRLLLMAFSGKQGRSFRSDALNLAATARQHGVPVYLERAGDSTTIRAWIFFASPVDLRRARRLGAALLLLASSEAGSGPWLKSFVACLPGEAQGSSAGTSPIELPLGGRSASPTSSWAFVQAARGLPAYPSQWGFLASAATLSSRDLDALLAGFEAPSSPGSSTRSRKREDWDPYTLDAWAEGTLLVRRPLPPGVARDLRAHLVVTTPRKAPASQGRKRSADLRQRAPLFERLEAAWRLPPGALQLLRDSCKAHHLELRVHDLRTQQAPQALLLGRALRPAQAGALSAILELPGAVLEANDPSDRSTLALALAAQTQRPTLVLVASEARLEPWKEEALLWLTLDECGALEETEGAGPRSHPLTLATVAQLTRCAAHLTDGRFHTLIIDDCHKLAPRTLLRLLARVPHHRVLGLAPELRAGEDPSSWLLPSLGPTVRCAALDSEALQIDVVLRPTSFLWHPWMEQEPFVETGELFHLDYPAAPPSAQPTRRLDPAERSREWNSLLETLSHDAARNQQVIEDVTAEALQGHRCLVHTQRRDHAMLLADMLQARVAVTLAVGSMSATSRRESLERYRDGRAQVLVVTGPIVSAGFEVAATSRLFLAAPLVSERQLTTLMERLAQRNPERSSARLYDYLDEHVPRLDEAARARRRTYRRAHTTLNADSNQLRLPLEL